MPTYGSSSYGAGPYGSGEPSLPGTFTQRLYESLPTLYRDSDSSGQLLAYISLLGDQADAILTLADRISYVAPDDGGAAGDTSDLTDPATADAAWLPWLSQLVGVTITPGTTTQGQRDAIADVVSSFRAGTKDAIAGAARSALTGTRYVAVYEHSINSPGDGTEWDVMIVTRPSETPDADAVLQAVIDKRAKPAGVVLHHRDYGATWSAVSTAYPTWASRAGRTWIDIEETTL